MAGQLLLIVIVAVVVHNNAIPQPTHPSMVPYKTYPSLAPYHPKGITIMPRKPGFTMNPRDTAAIKSRPLRNNGGFTMMPRKLNISIDPRDTVVIKSRPLRNKEPGFTQQPRVPSFLVQPKDTVSIKTRPLRLTYAADYTLECKKKKQVAKVSPGESVQFSSVNYPNNYKGKAKCKWQLKGSTDTTRFSISCDAFELQNANKKGKCSDFLEIDNWKFCGTDYPVYNSDENVVNMFFKTNKKKHYSGFTCTATAYDASTTTEMFTTTPTPTLPTIPTTEEPTGTCSCGHVNRATRIVGGVETEVNEYPWMVALAWSEYSSNAFCGASIINKEWILTAAHCADVMSNSNVVVAGEHSWYFDDETSSTQKIAIEQILMHPNYDSGTLDNDIALLKLASPLSFDANVAPVCPPDATDRYENVDAIVTGWGTLASGGDQPDTLREVVVPTMTNSECQSGYGDYITDNMLCAGYDAGGKDSCQGDSGGPLVTADGSVYRQIGVVSWGYGCAYEGYPGVYARVNNYLEWVSSSISGSSWCDAGTTGPVNSTPAPPVTTAPPTDTPTGTCSCGKINRATRIVGGVETEVNEYPWMVALAWSSSSSNAFCGASIINERWVLTASHCADVMSTSNVVVVGEHSWSTGSETSSTQTIAIEQIVMHPNYNSGTLDHDVALLKLASPLAFDANVAPICPPDATDRYENVDAIVTGWGTLSSGGSQPNSLQEVVVPTMTNSECQSGYGSSITDNMLCAGYDAGGKDSCQGDSGGPLITADGSVYRQIGVVSWGYGCAYEGYPGVYARVNNELEWITSTISGTSWCDAGDAVTSGPVNTTPNPGPITGTGTCSCGRINRSTRIVGGVETEVNEYPWMVALAWSSSSSNAFCGASILNERWILTASHCADVMSTSNVVVVGEHNWSSSSETSATAKYAIEQILVHPNYNSGTLDNDVALIKLASALTFDDNNNVAPVCPPDENNLYENVDAIVTGWGTLSSGGDQPDVLQEVVVPTMTNSECQSGYGSSITDNMLCAGYDAGGKDSCQGDSGGPLITADGSVHRQIGVVSWGYGCAYEGYPGVYARVTSQMSWIKTSISGTSWCDAGTAVTSGPVNTTPAPTGDCKCGRVNRSTRIINGQETEVLEYPWQAGLISSGSTGRTWCGGSLINSKWVLTAAHCTEGASPSQLQVLLGEHTIYESDGEQRFDVSTVINHPSYTGNPWTNGHDISLLELSTEVDFSSTSIRPICLPTTSELFAGADATVTGWGTTNSGSQSLVLMEVDIPVVTNTVCEYTYGSSNIDDTMICAGEGAGNGACMGDSGGPLITSLGDYHVQIGVVSFGSSNCDALGVYARVTALKSWIDSYAMSGSATVCSP